MSRKKSKWQTHKDESTDTAHRGGTARMSVEVPVMGMEQRGCVIQVLTVDQLCQSRGGING